MKVVALSGGIGGAKLALGLKRVLPEGGLTVIANTGDDFEHFGLTVSPDIDTLIYTLSGLADTSKGWGRADETWTFMAALEQLGGETWFNLGDGDLAMHVLRSARLAKGDCPADITADVSAALGVGATILPMSDNPVRTQLRTDDGWLDFQDYFVARQAVPVVHEIRYQGVESAKPATGVIEAIASPDTDAIVICPSNPLISIEPILAVPGILQAIADASAPVIAISPIIKGKAIKGPTAKMLRELGQEATAATVLERYRAFLDVFIADPADVAALSASQTSPSLISADIMMVTLDDRERLAHTVLEAARCARTSGHYVPSP